MNIEFFYEEIDFRLENKDSLQGWIVSMIESEGYTTESLNYILCSDEYLLNINKEYLNHDTFTDIITFDNSESENTIAADIFISIDRVKDNSQSQSTSFQDELSRVLIHGILHLMGWNDKTDALKKEMRKKEDACLSLR
jgi:rRNA maturation RNase YbeY